MAEEEKRGKATARKTVDKWKRKKWYTLVAPKSFSSVEIGETPAEKDEVVMGRVIFVNANDVSKQGKKSHIVLKFKVNEVKGNKAHTELVGHMVKPSYVRRLVRRRSSKMETSQLLATKDGKKIKVKVFAITAKKVAKKKESAIRKAMEEETRAICANTAFEDCIQEFVFGNVLGKMFDRIKKVASIKKLDVIFSQLVGEGSDDVQRP